MSSNVVNTVPYLRTTREFPEEVVNLRLELNKAYIDIANCVNARTIGIFSQNSPSITGENWSIQNSKQQTYTNNRQQTFRQVFPFVGPVPGAINHNIKTAQFSGFTRIYGTFTNGSNWYPLPYVDVLNANNQVNVIVTPTQIIITKGAGTPPVITTGFVVLEWLSRP